MSTSTLMTRRRPIFLALASLAGWTAVGMVFALPRFAQAVPWWTSLRLSLGAWWAWGLLVPLIVAVDRRLPIAVDRIGLRVAAHVPLGAVVTLVYAYLSAVLQVLLQALPSHVLWSAEPLRESVRGGMLWSLLVYLLILGGWQAVQYSQHYLASQLRLERLERGFSEARLNALRMQLDPHFLFNALNTVSSLVVGQPRLARDMIEQLGDLLRLSLDSGGRQQVSLADELEFLGHYLAIQHTRFGDHLKVDIDVPNEARAWMVPSLILQPLVENAIRHGLAPRPGGGSIWVRAVVDEGHVVITVDDDGVGLPADWHKDRMGLGLGVTRERIAMLHPGTAAALAIEPRPGGGTRVRVTIPFADPLEAAA
jgi:two-component system, LytTR family, sensor kinase